jgi:hypothetical protein
VCVCVCVWVCGCVGARVLAQNTTRTVDVNIPNKDNIAATAKE